MISANLSLIATDLSWADLVLDNATSKKLLKIRSWLKQASSLKNIDSINKKIKTGYRALFAGTADILKTQVAAVLGEESRQAVYTIDLSKVVSKYIGETEKNLEEIFSSAENKNWILFFDEANALFGKRTNVKDSHDRFANAEVSYLLQRMEDYKGLAILASNLKGNIDDAFTRRFQIVVRFPKPPRVEKIKP